MKTRWILASAIAAFCLTTLARLECWVPQTVLLAFVAPALAESNQAPTYEFSLTWGEEGTGPGQFQQPIGIVVKGNEVFVSDSGNHRIQVFDRQGKFLRAFGQEGTQLGDLNQPMSMGLHGETLYVTEYLNDRVQRFSLSGESKGGFGTSGSEPGQFDAPADVAVDRQGQAYVVDFYNQRVQVFDPSGAVIRQYGATGQPGSDAGLFNYPTGVGLLPNGDLLVADAYNNRIQVFQPDGRFVRSWTGAEPSDSRAVDGRFRTASAVTSDADGRVFVADFYNHRIQLFTSEGEFITLFGTMGQALGQLDRPTDITIDDEGAVYVVDYGNNRIQKFSRR